MAATYGAASCELAIADAPTCARPEACAHVHGLALSMPVGYLRGMRNLVLSLFPGVDLLGRAFAATNFCVVMGPDPVTGGDIREFAGVPGRFDGVIGGPPCQGFSCANAFRNDSEHKSVQHSRAMLVEFARVVAECSPAWWLCENVPAVPDVRVPGYAVQRVPLTDWECGGHQIRTRHFQFGHRNGWIIRPVRSVNCRRQNGRKATAITTKPNSRWFNYREQCRRQGMPEPISLPGWTREAKFRAIGNGVPWKMGCALAAAVADASPITANDCPCGCGRQLQGKQRSATASCRKRLQLIRDNPRDFVTPAGYLVDA